MQHRHFSELLQQSVAFTLKNFEISQNRLKTKKLLHITKKYGRIFYATGVSKGTPFDIVHVKHITNHDIRQRDLTARRYFDLL